MHVHTIGFPTIETLNGQMLEACNRAAAELAARTGKPGLAGSDAHTLTSLGLTYTEVKGTGGVSGFLESVRRGNARPVGEGGSYWKLIRAIYRLGCAMFFAEPWTLLLAPLLPIVPAITLANMLREIAFARSWRLRMEDIPLASNAATAWSSGEIAS